MQASDNVARILLLDLGGVVLGINFRRVFRYWANAAGVEESVFYDNWKLDDAYKAQETGELDFAGYTEHLSRSLNVVMSDEQWREGWNALWVQPYKKVNALFPSLKKRFQLCAFSNTNAVHAESFLNLYPDVFALFDQLYLSYEIGCRKPAPESFLRICSMLQCQPNQVTFLDDSQENIEGAKLAGFTAHLTRSESEVVQVLKSLQVS